MSRAVIKWDMVGNTFVGERDGYTATVIPCGALGYNYWLITKDGIVVSECYSHTPSKGELNGKVQVERILFKILNQ